MSPLLLIFLGLLLVPLLWLAWAYNSLVGLRNQFRRGYAQIDVQLKRRYDLIPRLVATAQGYLRHERETFEAVIAARNAAVSAGERAAATPGEAAGLEVLRGAEGALAGALGRLWLLREDYPELKADRVMSQLMEDLTSAENRVAFARQAFNDAVMAYNTRREVFPVNLIAGAFAFDPAALFEIGDPQERAVPKVSL